MVLELLRKVLILVKSWKSIHMRSRVWRGHFHAKSAKFQKELCCSPSWQGILFHLQWIHPISCQQGSLKLGNWVEKRKKKKKETSSDITMTRSWQTNLFSLTKIKEKMETLVAKTNHLSVTLKHALACHMSEFLLRTLSYNCRVRSSFESLRLMVHGKWMEMQRWSVFRFAFFLAYFTMTLQTVDATAGCIGCLSVCLSDLTNRDKGSTTW